MHFTEKSIADIPNKKVKLTIAIEKKKKNAANYPV